MVRYQPSGKQKRITRGRRISKYQAWNIYNKEKSFVKAAIRAGLDESTFRKAYYRDFEEIMDERYAPNEHSKKKKFIYVEKGNCGKCPKRGTCKRTCPDAEAYIEQEEKSRDSQRVLEKWYAENHPSTGGRVR